jgi:hypothetical protein
VAGTLPTNLEYHKLFGALPPRAALLILLTLDVRVNRPNYPTSSISTSMVKEGYGHRPPGTFDVGRRSKIPTRCEPRTRWGADPRRRPDFQRGDKVPYGGISDIPGPVTLLGLVPTDEGGGGRTMDPAYVLKRFDISKPTTVFVPSD